MVIVVDRLIIKCCMSFKNVFASKRVTVINRIIFSTANSCLWLYIGLIMFELCKVEEAQEILWIYLILYIIISFSIAVEPL